VFRSAGPQVAVVDKDGAVVMKDVKIASDNGSSVAIGSGLAAGDKAILNLSSQIAPGEKVELNGDKEGDTKSVAAQ
jgi:hypothetical protein